MRRLALPLACAALATASLGNEPGQPVNSTAIENPFRGVMQDRTSRSPAEALYVEKCSMCHRRMGMGTVLLGRRVSPDRAMLEARDDLTVEFVTNVVRQGLGNMPRISRAEVSDRQLATIAAYLSTPKPK